MRAAPNTIARMAEPTLAISSANGSVPCIHRKVTSTRRVFCNINTINATRVSAAAQTPPAANHGDAEIIASRMSERVRRPTLTRMVHIRRAGTMTAAISAMRGCSCVAAVPGVSPSTTSAWRSRPAEPHGSSCCGAAPRGAGRPDAAAVRGRTGGRVLLRA
jgi:hypothetical protein